jgi:CspA family cold shock protein
MTDENTSGRLCKGHVKWFDPGKGFGFVVSDEGGPDILLHANVLRNFGQSSVADGAEIEIVVLETERGLQASEVRDIRVPDTVIGGGLTDFADMSAAELAAAPMQPARVKWFDKVKGFGFANIFGVEDDVFVHIEVLRRSGLADLIPGEAIGLRAAEGARGLMATEVLPWEAGLREDAEDPEDFED